MSNKRMKSFIAVALLSTMGLVACNDNIQAKPTNYNDPLITFTEEGDEVYNNLVSIIDDAYRDGTLASAVLDKILYVYATSVFGTYNRVVTPEAKAEDVNFEIVYETKHINAKRSINCKSNKRNNGSEVLIYGRRIKYESISGY